MSTLGQGLFPCFKGSFRQCCRDIDEKEHMWNIGPKRGRAATVGKKIDVQKQLYAI
jgi:hypothetical protein